jgi:hypothetical protein
MKSAFFSSAIRRSIPVVAALALVAIVGPAHATNLVQNGDFSATTGASSGELGVYTTATDWSSTGYNFLYASSTVATQSGATGTLGNVLLWAAAPSPDGGAFLAADGAFEQGAITQTITGLTAGQTYAVTFSFAGAQQLGFTGDTTEAFDVSLGGSAVQETAILNDDSHGFTGWSTDTMIFTADSSSDVLSFLAVGTPSGVPPMSLLDGVSMTATPEPSSLALLATGCFGVGGILRSRFKKSVA